MASTLWKLSGIGLWNGASLDIRAARLWAEASRVEASATLSASDVPASGSLADIVDADAVTGCAWERSTVRNPGFFIGFTFASDVELTAMEVDVGSGSITELQLCQFKDGLWNVVFSNWFGASESVMIGRPSAYQAAVLADGPATYLPCSESSGDAQDVVGGSAGFNVSSNAIRAQDKLMAGAVAMVMPGQNGSNPLLSAKNTSVGNVSGDFTLEFVMRGVSLPNVTRPIIFSKEMGGMSWPEYRLQFEAGALNLVVRYGNSDTARGVDQTVNLSVLDNKRHHIAFTRQASRYRLVIDGIAVMDVTSEQTPLTNLGVLSVCGDSLLPGYPSSPFNGAVSGVALYNKALTPLQIAAHIAAMGAETIRRVRMTRADTSFLRGHAPSSQRGMLRLDCRVARDMEFGGRGFVYGTVLDDKTQKPLQRRVRLRRSRDGLLARETWSLGNGSYRFDDIDERYEYDIEAWDHEKNFFSTVANNQLPEVAA